VDDWTIQEKECNNKSFAQYSFKKIATQSDEKYIEITLFLKMGDFLF